MSKKTKHTFLVIDRTERCIAITHKLGNARKQLQGIDGRRILKLDPEAPLVELKTVATAGGAWRVRAKEVQS